MFEGGKVEEHPTEKSKKEVGNITNSLKSYYTFPSKFLDVLDNK